MKLSFGICGVLILLASLLMLADAAGQTAENYVTAHRGNCAEWPENTLDAFRSGINLGCDWIETDVYLTADGQLVLIHDASTGRIAEKNLQVEKSRFDELRALDVAAGFRKANNLDLSACPKQTMPTLGEALDLILSEKKARLSLQPKCDCVDQIVALVKEKGAEGWVGFNDDSLAKMTRAKELLPDAVIFWDRRNSDLTKDIAIALERGFDALVLHQSDVTTEAVKQIDEAGLVPGVWTVNGKETIRRFRAFGVRRFYTDTPAEAFAALSEQ